MNLAPCRDLPRHNLVGTWYRAVDPRFLATALSTAHTSRISSRFSPATPAQPAFEILYLAENPLVTLFEAQALFGSPSTPGGLVPHPGRPLVTLPMSLDLTDVIDCTDSLTATMLETNAQELTGDWRAFGNRPVPSVHAGRAPTQSLGQALFETGEVKALLNFSARLPDYKILGLFTQRIIGSSCSVRYSYRDLQGELKTIRIP